MSFSEGLARNLRQVSGVMDIESQKTILLAQRAKGILPSRILD
jgi:hypothetical protein